MRKPKAFLAEIAMIAGSSMTSAIAQIVRPTGKYPTSYRALAGSSIASMGASLAYATLRDERFAQRVLDRLDALADSHSALTEGEGAVASSLDELSSRVEKIPLNVADEIGNNSRVARLEAIERQAAEISEKLGQLLANEAKKTAAPKSDAVGASSSLTRANSNVSPKSNTSEPENSHKETPERDQLNRIPSFEEVNRRSSASGTELLYAVKFDRDLPGYEPLRMKRQPLRIAVDVRDATSVKIGLTLLTRAAGVEPKAALLTAKVLDESANVIDCTVLPHHSDKYGNFTYLATEGEETKLEFDLYLPISAEKLILEVRPWAVNPNLQNAASVRVLRKRENWKKQRQTSEVKVAAILDEFSYNAFKFECDLRNLSYDNWRVEMETHQPELFLCESAWSGGDSIARPWKGRIYASENLKGENRQALLEILEYCKSRNIPTVFWNKEDPSHYDDKRHNFVETALEFDHIFTTDVNCVQRYRLEHGHPSVHTLPFGVQPRLFNPIYTGTRSSDVVFAGGWYANHVNRSKDMEIMFEAVERSGRKLKIYDRFFDSQDPTKIFPHPYSEYRTRPVPGDQMAQVYKESEIGMTVNTETKSPTMFARRIFELMACNTFVVSNYSVGVERYFGEDVLFLDRDPDALSRISRAEIEEAKATNLRRVLTEHTYSKRLEKILRVAGVDFREEALPSGVAVRVDNYGEAKAAFELLTASGNWAGKKLILLKPTAKKLDFADSLADFNRNGISVYSEAMITSGTSDIAPALAETGGVVVGSLNDIEAIDSVEATIGEFLLHTQYSDLPIVELPRDSAAPRYSFVKYSCECYCFVKPACFTDLLVALQRDGSALAYAI